MKFFLKHKKRWVCSFFCFFVLISSFSQTTDSVFSYQYIHYKGIATIVIEGQTFSGQFNFVNEIDSFFYVQLNVGGLEAGRILATPENILYINKLQKNYYDGGYDFFQQFIDVEVDFFTLQAIFNHFETEVPEDLELSYEGEISEDGYSFFSMLICEHEVYPLKLQMEIKKVTFNSIPKVSASVPKNFKEIKVF
jgi:hypothetical protein